MFFKNMESTDKRILGVCVLLLLLSLFFILNDNWVYRLTGVSSSDLEQIGEVTTLENDVRRRHQIAFTWLPLEKQNNVFQGDSIFTGNSSGVIIKTKTGEQITIAANSLVVVRTREDSVSLDIGFGSVEGKVQKGKTLRITSNNSVTELDGSDAVVKVDAGEGNKLVLNVIAGEVKVKSADGVQFLKRNETTEIDSSNFLQSPSQNGIQVLFPLANQRFQFLQDRPTIFKWRVPRKLSRMKIKIATDQEMKNTLVDTSVQDPSYTAFNLPVDIPLYWQVLSESALSEVTPFYLVGNAPPQLVSPQQGLNLFYDAANRGPRAGVEAVLEWAGGSPSLRYEVALADNSLFEGPQIFKTTDTKYKTALLPAGQYYWRVRSIDFKNTKWSETANFKVGPEPARFLPLPLMQMTSNEHLLRTKMHKESAAAVHAARNQKAISLVENFPTLQWGRIAGADDYEIQVSSRLDFSNIVVARRVKENFFVFKTASPGTYFWRVKARNLLYKDGSFSKPNELTVRLAPPAALTLSAIIEEVPEQALLLAPTPPVELKWNATVATYAYQVQFSKDSQFSAPLEFVTSNTSRKVQIPSVGNYFWRVRSLNEKSEALSPWGSYSISFQRVYKDPALSDNLLALYPKQQDSLVMVGQGSSEIVFKWNTPYEKARYRMEISYDPDFKTVIHSAVSNSNTYILKDRLLSNTVYWRVRAEKPNEYTQWTAANRFYVTYEASPFDYQTSELLFASRLKARERQQELLAEARRQIIKLRTPASKMEWQLETPRLTSQETMIELEPNWPASVTQAQLNKQKLDEFFSQVKTYPTFKWDKVAAAERYFIEIARDREFKNIVVTAPSFNPFYQWETVRPGQYYWRVQAFNDRYTRSNHSVTQPLWVAVRPPQITNSDVFTEVFDDPREMWSAPQPGRLSWTPTIFAKGYEVEFADNIDFKRSQTYKTDTSTYEVSVLHAGLYHWRVKALNEHGIAISEWSKPQAVEFAQTSRRLAGIQSPTGLFPKDRTLVWVGKGQIDVPFHVALPSQGPGVIEISTDREFTNILTQIETRGDKVKVRGAAWPEGSLFWRVRDSRSLREPARAGVNASVSQIYEFIFKKEPEPYRKRPGSKIKSLNP